MVGRTINMDTTKPNHCKDESGALFVRKKSVMLRVDLLSGAVSVVVTNPVIMKVHTAAIERVLTRAIPHTPCPVVHPLPSRVPKPTRPPARTYPIVEGTGMLVSFPKRSSSAKYVLNTRFENRRKLDRNANFHAMQGSLIAFTGSRTVVETIPLAPSISPLKSSKMAAEPPAFHEVISDCPEYSLEKLSVTN